MDTPNDPLRDAARRMLERGIAPEKVKAFVQRARERERANAKDTKDAGQLSTGLKAATFVERGVNSASFGLGGLAGDAIAAGLDSDKSFKDVRAERSDRNKQLGPLGYLADVAGAAMPGVAAFKTLSAIPRIAKMGAVKVAAAEAAGQGGITGAAEGLDDLSAEGVGNAAKAGAATAVGGAVLGAGVGKAAGSAAKWWKGRNLTKELVARGVNVEEAQLLARELPTMTMEKANAAMGRVDEMVTQGRGADVMAADVMGSEGHNTLRASMNIAGDAETVAKERLRSRDAGIVRRGRADLGEAAGFTPEQMDAHENSLLATRKAKADQSFAKARSEGGAYDNLADQVSVAPAPSVAQSVPPSTRDAIDAFRTRLGQTVTRKEGTTMQQVAREGLERRGARIEAPEISGNPKPVVDAPKFPDDYADVMRSVDDAAADPVVVDEMRSLVSANQQAFGKADPRSFDVQLELYQRINKQLRAMEGSPSADPQVRRSLLTAKEKLGRALELRSPEFRPANADYAEYSRGLEAYETGQDAASQSFPSEARRVAKKADPTQGTELNKGFVDRMSEQLGKGPNEQLGPAAAANNSIRNAMVGTENAAEKIRDRLGVKAEQKLLGNAKAEGRMAATSGAGLSGSSTAKQQYGLADLMNVVEMAGASVSANPIWMGTQFARRAATNKMSGIRKNIAAGAAKKISDALTRGGEKEAKSVLEDLIAEMNRREMADAAGKSVARRTRNAVARAAAPNQ